MGRGVKAHKAWFDMSSHSLPSLVQAHIMPVPARAARRRGCRGQDQPRTGRVIHPTHAEAYGMSIEVNPWM